MTPKVPTYFLVTPLENEKIRSIRSPTMVGSKGRSNVSWDNILRLTIKSLSTNEQHEFEDLMNQVREAVKKKLCHTS